MILILYAPIRDLIHTARLYRKLCTDGILVRAKRRNRGYLLTRVLTVILLLFLVLTSRIDPGNSWRPVEKVPVDAAAQLAFPTMEVFLPGADSTDLERAIQTRSHWLHRILCPVWTEQHRPLSP